MTKNLLALVLIFISLQSFSQIKGRIVDQKNEPLPFVNIYVENTFTGTTSNDEGDYELNLTKPDTYKIIFKFLGYKTVKKTLRSNNSLTCWMLRLMKSKFH